MAMLAEPRRKQKWSVDPRNSAWSKDESKFGQKMLERMGWSKGKGLGKSEQGATEHIKVKVKNNSLGLGNTANYEDNWIAHQDDFNQLLAELNNCHGQSDPTAEQKQSFSLEEKSKTSKKRVHYMKFTKGKDLSNRSETDLACIFGKRTKKSKDQEESGSSQESQEESEKGEAEEVTPDPEAEAAINTVTSTLTMQEYFAQRMAQLKGRQASAATTETREDAPNTTLDACGHARDTLALGKAKSKKKKKKKEREEEAQMEESADPHTDKPEAQEESNTGRKKKKRKHADREMEREDCAISCAVELCGNQDQVPEDAVSHAHRKKKAKRCSEEETQNSDAAAEEETADAESSDKKRRRKKKKNREEGEPLVEEEKKCKKDKKKKRKHD
ncbi:PIN2/TERF1-interacting telomerase inhibitor 1 [Megalops cyprinoides]|uniref:PIN2/TERF1-interacting telomerase inhibitor 1 n=1 Tax=Megalops cyprinoides TaxID=118141 RepID=UPI0018643BCC|nr:PIN2/TERF1-interacting telomerase inhibitor 1 [Megalops cyprinoides]